MLSVRHVAVAITATLHAISGIFLSVLALSLQRLFPSLQQLPPSSRHISEPVDLPKKHSSPRRDSGYSIHTGTSDGVSSDESLETFPSTPQLSPKDSLDNHAALLLASQERARAARPSGFTPSSLLWPLKEYPSPKPSQLGGEYVAPPLSGVSPDACHSPTVASYRFSVPPQEEQLSEASSIRVKRTRHRHCLPLLPLHRKGSRLLSISHSGRSLRKSSTSPHLREAATLSRKGSPSSHNHRHTSVSEHVRKIVAITPRHKCKASKRKREKNRLSESASRVGRRRTDPYQAPYFFPSPVSPLAHEYARLVRLDRKLLLNTDVPASSSSPVRPEDDR